jgi:hypothetical protein
MIVVIALAAVIALTGGTALASGPVAVSGTVTDGTAGAALPSGLTATLEGVDAQHRAVLAQAATVDGRGTFRFDGVAPAAGATYAVVVDYGGARYWADVTGLDGGSPPPVALKIYEPTTSDSALRITSSNWIFTGFDPQNQQVTVLETMTIANRGDRTYVGDHRGDPGSDAPGVLPRTIPLPLPTGASDFTPAMGVDASAVLPVSGGYVDSEPVVPGELQVAYTYRIAYADGGVEIRKSLPYATDELHFLVPNQGLELRSDHLASAGTLDVQGQQFVVLGAQSVPANTDVTVDVLGLPNPPASRLGSDAMRAIGVGLVVPLLVAGLVLGLRARKPRRREVAGDRRALLASIAHLDDRYAAGKLDAERYQAERARKKGELVDLLLRSAASADAVEVS